MWVRKKIKKKVGGGGARWADSFGFQTFQRLPQVFICRQAESQEEEFLSLCSFSGGGGCWGGWGGLMHRKAVELRQRWPHAPTRRPKGDQPLCSK